jgi:serine/threonine protein kinase
LTLGQISSLVTLCVLVYLTGSSSWYSFEEHHTYSDSSDINFEFYIDEIDTDSYYDSDYGNLGDMEDKMSKHELLFSLTTMLSLVILAFGVFRISSVDNAKSACFVLVILSFTNGMVFLLFPWALEEESDWFNNHGIEESAIAFSGTYIDVDTDPNGNIQYTWGPQFAWYSSTIIIPLYGLILMRSMNSWSRPAISKGIATSNQNQYGLNSLPGGKDGFKGVSISIPNSPIITNPQTGSAVINDLASQSSQTTLAHERVNENIVWNTTEVYKDESFSSNKIIFSMPDLRERYEVAILLTSEKSVYVIEGLITLSGCSEILFGTRKSDGRMVVVKRPYGYKKKEEKEKKGRVNTYASAKKQLENEHQVLSRMMRYNKTNFPELLDCFNQKVGRRTDLYMVTKYFSPSLKKYVEFHGGKKGGLEFERALNLLLEIAAAVKEIHEKLGYVWADLKSENILMQEDTPVLIDFGTSTPPVSGKGKVKIDSGGWSAPETIEGAPVFESDIYSLGKLFAYLLTEIQPKPKQKFEVFRAQVSHELKKRNIDARIAEIITKCSSEKITDRYGSVSELLDDLQDFWQELRVQCPDCNIILGIHAKFCKACGKKKARIVKKKKARIVKKKKKVTKTKAYRCAECDQSVDSDSKYCKNCGTEVMQPNPSKIQCPDCEEFIPGDAKYCNNCGTAVREKVK